MSEETSNAQALFDSLNNPSFDAEEIKEVEVEAVETVEAQAEPVVEETPQPEPEVVAEVETKDEGEPEAVEAKEEDAETQIPKSQYDEIRAKQKADRAELDEFKARENAQAAQIQQLQSMVLQSQQRQAPQAEAEEVYIDPDTQNAMQQMQNSFEQKLENMRVQSSLDIAASKYADEYGEAEKFVISQNNPALAREIMQAANPGEATVRFFRQNKVLETVGDDPLKYQEQLEEKLLNDPAFIEKVMANGRTKASQSGGSGSKPHIAPSVNRGSRAASASTGVSQAGEMSPQEMFNHATGKT